MRAKMKGIMLVDGNSIESFFPDNLKEFYQQIIIDIGPEDTDESEIFDMVACSINWLGVDQEFQGYLWKENALIIPEYDSTLIMGIIEKRVANCQGEKWEDIVIQLKEFLGWEFDYYRE